MNEVTLSWIAGFWEGEGTVGVYRRDKKSKYLRLRTAIGQKDPKVLYWIKDTLGFGNVVASNHCYIWQCSHQHAEDFLRLISPYLKFRGEQVDTALKQRAYLLSTSRVWFDNMIKMNSRKDRKEGSNARAES